MRPYDDSTLFCPAGMQQFKPQFRDTSYKGKTVANIQPCIRLNDYDEMGDGTHLLYFNMMGLFSFRHLTLQEAIDFWMTFVQEKLGLKIQYVTLHRDKLKAWTPLYAKYNVDIRIDDECTWSDGTAPRAYCTEFYIKDIEIGNIVNPGGDCIDVGFGFERLDSLVNGTNLQRRTCIMQDTINIMLDSGFNPDGQKQGSILRRLIQDYTKPTTLDPENERYYDVLQGELDRRHLMQQKYNQLRKAKKRQNKDKAWWFSTYGINVDLCEDEA